MDNTLKSKSETYWADGLACVQAEHWNPAAHSLYYGLFQAVYGYAEAKGILDGYKKPINGRDPSVHEVAQHIVSSWRGRDSVRVYRALKAARVKADYKPGDVTEADLKDCLHQAGAWRDYFINACTV